MLRAEDIYRRTMELVKNSGTRDARTIADDLGIRVFEEKKLTSLLGAYTCMDGFRIIILNARLSPKLEQIILGHEVGHDVFHRTEGLVDGISHSMNFLKEISEKEYEANAFCAHLTLDNEDVVRTLHMGYSLEECAGMLETVPELLNIKIREMKRMGYDFPDVECSPRFLKTIHPDGMDECFDGFFTE